MRVLFVEVLPETEHVLPVGVRVNHRGNTAADESRVTVGVGQIPLRIHLQHVIVIPRQKNGSWYLGEASGAIQETIFHDDC